MSDNWYYEFNGKPMGPVPLTDLMRLLSGRASPKDVLVWGSGFADWQRAGTVPALNAEFVLSPKEPEAPPNSSSSHAYFQGENEEVEVFERGLVLRRRGIERLKKSDRSIPYSDIVAVHFRNPGFVNFSSITFALEQGSKKPSVMFVIKDPNSVRFGPSHQEDYIKLRKFLDTKIKSQTAIAANPDSGVPMPPSKKVQNLHRFLMGLLVGFPLVILVGYCSKQPGSIQPTAKDACSTYTGDMKRTCQLLHAECSEGKNWSLPGCRAAFPNGN